MKPLLRFQAVLVLRQVMTPDGALVIISLAVLFGGLWLGDVVEGRSQDGPAAMTIVAAFVIAMSLMVYTLDGMDVVRWTSPVSAHRTLWAHMLFWTVMCAVPAAGVAYLRSTDGHDALPLLVGLVLLGASGAALAFVLQRLLRRWGPIALVFALGSVVGSATAAGTAGVVASMEGWGLWTALLGIVFCIALVAGHRSYLGAECLPVAGGNMDAADASLEQARGGPTGGKTPAASLLRATWPPLYTGLWVAFGIAIQMIPRVPDLFQMFWIGLVVLNLANIALSSWKWLLPTPLDRGRAFRVLFLPLVVFAAFAATTRVLVLELGSDRTVFFYDIRKDPSLRTDGLLVQGDILRVDHEAHVYSPPEPPFMAARVREHLCARYGLQVSEGRILAIILHGWPPDLADSVMNQQEATLDAMERVRIELGPEIVASDRLRSAVNAVFVVLVSLLFLRLALVGYRWSRISVMAVGLSFMIMVFVLSLTTSEAWIQGVLNTKDAIYAAFLNSPPPVLGLLFLLVAGGAFVVWKNCVGAFRRLDITDLAPPVNAMGWWGMKE